MCHKTLFINPVITVIQYTRVREFWLAQYFYCHLRRFLADHQSHPTFLLSRVSIGRSLGYGVTAQEVAQENKMLERPGLSVPEQI
jgi:hypothetical protein